MAQAVVAGQVDNCIVHRSRNDIHNGVTMTMTMNMVVMTMTLTIMMTMTMTTMMMMMMKTTSTSWLTGLIAADN